MRPPFLSLLCTVLLASAARAGEPAPLAAAAPPEHLVWLEPLSTLSGLAVNLKDPGSNPRSRRIASRVLALSGGYSRTLSAGRSLTFQGFVMDYRQGCGYPEGECAGDTTVRASVGLMQSAGGVAHRGLFLEPRLILGYTRAHASWSDPDVSTPRYFPGSNGYSAQVGLDVGYQWQLRHFYVAPMLGVAVGASYNLDDVAPFMTVEGDGDSPLQLAMGLNLHLLRVGWTF